MYGYRPSTNSWSQIASGIGTGGSNTGIGIYSSYHDAAFLKGSRSGNPIYRVTPGPVIEARAQPPIPAKGGGGSNSHMTVLPLDDGRLIGVENWNGQDRYYISDDQGASWDLRGTHPMHNGTPTQSGLGGPFGSLQEHGVLWLVSENSAMVWRP